MKNKVRNLFIFYMIMWILGIVIMFLGSFYCAIYNKSDFTVINIALFGALLLFIGFYKSVTNEYF